MRFNVSVPFRTHLSELARELEALGVLGSYYTGYPKSRLKEVPSRKVRSFVWLLAPSVVLSRFGFYRGHRLLNKFALRAFDRVVAARLEPSDVFHFASGCGLLSMRAAKQRYGALTVCDVGSSHIGYRTALLAAEHERWGVPYNPLPPYLIERELQEYGESDLIAVPSSYSFRSFVEEGVPREKLLLAPYGVSVDLFRPQPKADGVFRVLFVGAVNLEKGVPYLLQAYKALTLRDAELWFVGQMRTELRPVLDRFKGMYRYFGFVPRRELHRYYSQASALDVPSINEGLALVQAQAMACGLPVIGTTHSGASELLSDGIEGFIVPPRNSEALAERIERLYRSPELLGAMRLACVARAKALNGWRNYAENMVARLLPAVRARL